MCKRAVILAGGKGTRLRPYTIVMPKPLVPVGEYPVLEIIIRQLAYYGFEHITLSVNHQAELIRAFCGDGRKWGIRIDYSLEDTPLSTMGPLTLIKDLPDDFLVMNGDVLTDLNFSEFFNFHKQNKRIFTISSYKRKEISEYGVIEQNEYSVMTRFIEKPARNYDVSMGIYILNKQILDYIPNGTFFGFDHLMYALLENKREVMIYNYQGYWLDIGRPDDYQQATEVLESAGRKLMPWDLKK